MPIRVEPGSKDNPAAVKYPGLDMEEFYSNLLAEHIIKRLDKFNRIRGFHAKPRPLQRFIFSTGLGFR